MKALVTRIIAVLLILCIGISFQGIVYTQDVTPIVTSVSPSIGPEAGGTMVTITGTGFTGATHVSLGGVDAAIDSVSDTQITATTPEGTGTVDVIVTTPDDVSSINSPYDSFTFVPMPAVNGISPSGGLTTGGTPVTITGSGFTDGNGIFIVSSVMFGDTPAVSFSFDLDTQQITATSPANSTAGTVDMTVTTPGGISVSGSNDQFTYYVPAPILNEINPSTGPTRGGTTVTITGTNFTDTESVMFGDTPAASFSFDQGTQQITAISPANSTAGAVNITVTTPSGTSDISDADKFTYYVPAPTITNINPSNGPTLGGTTVIITGTNFTDATAVSFGITPATIFHIDNDNQITAMSPANSTAGTVNITITTPSGTSTTSPSDQFTYNVPAPIVNEINPTTGPTTGGTTVTITGTNFTSTTGVLFGNKAAASFIATDTQITATSPANSTAGTVDVTVTTPAGTSEINSPDDQFTYYVPAPTITNINPSNGPTLGGTTVIITGTNFTDATAVSFGITPATIFHIDNDNQITAMSPANSTAGTVNITITTPSGTSTTSPSDQFTYVPMPIITSVSPSRGPLSGGISVTIAGTHLNGATDVNFGTTPATSLTVTDTQITAIAPAGTGTVHVTVTTPGGTSSTSSADQFTYSTAPAVTGISPSAGPTSGGTQVTITGVDLTAAKKVSFGSVAATSFTVVSDTQITAESPAGSAGTVDVTVTTAGGTSSIGSADQFTYTTAPVASFTSNVTSGSAPLTVQFNDTSSNSPTAWNWSFGDNTSNSDVRNATHTYANPGNYTITLNVTNAGGSDTTITTYNITVKPLSYTYDLYQGWTLISVPFNVSNNTIEALIPGDVLSNCVDIWGWNESSQYWTYYSPNPDPGYEDIERLTHLETGKAYWVEMTQPATFIINGTIPDKAPASPVQFTSQWSFVGPTGIKGSTPEVLYPNNVVDVWGWNETAQYWTYYSPSPDPGYQDIEPLTITDIGHGYWVEMPVGG